MKKFVAPEMEISKFAMEDIMTLSAIIEGIKPATDASYTFGGNDAVYGEF